jgi:hypothetical protein
MGGNNTSEHAVMKKIDLQPECKEKVPESQDEQTYSDDGVDLTLIRWLLSLTPTERLQTLQQSVQSLMRLRDASSLT